MPAAAVLRFAKVDGRPSARSAAGSRPYPQVWPVDGGGSSTPAESGGRSGSAPVPKRDGGAAPAGGGYAAYWRAPPPACADVAGGVRAG